MLEDDQICITTSKVDEMRSLYIHPLEKRIKEEYIRMNVQTSDNIVVEEKVIGNFDAFYLSIRDFREHPVASFEFRKEGGMLYVPKRLQE